MSDPFATCRRSAFASASGEDPAFGLSRRSHRRQRQGGAQNLRFRGASPQRLR
jgi:hypothetical protein